MIENWLPIHKRKRVGMITRRSGPSRLVHRFGYVIIHSCDGSSEVVWDDGEINVENTDNLRSLKDMGENPEHLPVYGHLDDMARRDEWRHLANAQGLAEIRSARMYQLQQIIESICD